MKLTSEEAAMLDRLRGMERKWPVTRWIILLLGILFFLSPLLHFLEPAKVVAHHETETGYSTTYQRAPLDSNLRLLPFVGLFLCMYVQTHWRGDPKRRLLIRLTDDAQKQSNHVA